MDVGCWIHGISVCEPRKVLPLLPSPSFKQFPICVRWLKSLLSDLQENPFEKRKQESMAHCWLCLSHVACRPPSPSMSTKQQPSSSSMHTSTMLLIHSRFHFSFSQENTVFTLTLSRSPMTCSAVRATSLPEQALPTKIFPSTWSKVSAREHRSCGVNVEKHFFTKRTIGMSFFDAFQEARAFGPLSRKRCVQGSSAGGSTRFKEATLLFTMTDG